FIRVNVMTKSSDSAFDETITPPFAYFVAYVNKIIVPGSRALERETSLEHDWSCVMRVLEIKMESLHHYLAIS
ncbi:8212_t:CDS:2, partial [Cetraspora pellucida]